MTTKKKSAAATTRPIAKPHNCYNVFFILERARLLESLRRGSSDNRPSPPSTSEDGGSSRGMITGYEFIDLPPLPPRYRHLEDVLPDNWYDPGKNKVNKRKHTKTNSPASFKEIARHVSASWREVDRPTREFVDDVARLLKRRYRELEEADGLVCLDASSSAAAPPSPPASSMPRTVSNGSVGSSSEMTSFPSYASSNDFFLRSSDSFLYCLPTVDHYPTDDSADCSTDDGAGYSTNAYSADTIKIDKDIVLDPHPAPVASGIMFGYCGTASPEAAAKMLPDRIGSSDGRMTADRVAPAGEGYDDHCGLSDRDVMKMCELLLA